MWSHEHNQPPPYPFRGLAKPLVRSDTRLHSHVRALPSSAGAAAPTPGKLAPQEIWEAASPSHHPATPLSSSRNPLEDNGVQHGAETLHDVSGHEPRHALLDALLGVHLANRRHDQLLLRQLSLLLDSLLVRLDESVRSE